ncbi:MAG: glutaredoxin family protein [Nitrosomonadales bacterium]|nr:glutaredoxin family protein [Nitrosomonadales bacterium]
MRFFWLIGLAAFALSSAASAEFYRWVDSAGKVHYGDALPADAQRSEQKSPTASVVEGKSDQSYATRRAHERYPVTLYVAENCVEACTQARNLLNKRGIPFSERRLVTPEEIAAFKQESGGNGTPALAVGRKYLLGFQAGEWNGELDAAGYPKLAPYRPQDSSVR